MSVCECVCVSKWINLTPINQYADPNGRLQFPGIPSGGFLACPLAAGRFNYEQSFAESVLVLQFFRQPVWHLKSASILSSLLMA